MRILKSRRSLVALLAVAVVATVASPASAEDPEAVIAPESADVDDVRGEGLSEARQYAAMYGVSTKEAKRRLKEQARLEQIGRRLAEIEGDRFAGFGFDNDEEFGAWLMLTGDEPPSRRSQNLARANAELEIKVGAKHSHDELVAGATVLAEQSMVLGMGLTGVGISMRDNALNAYIDPEVPEALTAAAEARTMDTREAEVTSMMSKVDTAGIEVNLRHGKRAETQAFIGGRFVSGNNDWPSRCTTGFAVRWDENGEQRRGMLTAGHCIYGMNLPDDGGVFTARLVNQGNGFIHSLGSNLHRVWNPVADVALIDVMGTQSRVKHKFFNGKKTKNVGGIFLAAEDSFVCHHGKGSAVIFGERANSCGEVTDPNYAPMGAGSNFGGTFFQTCNWGPCQPVYVRVAGPNLVSCAGDSGGPVYQPNTPPLAVGLLTHGTFNCLDTPFNDWTDWDPVEDSISYQPILDSIDMVEAITGITNMRLCDWAGPAANRCS